MATAGGRPGSRPSATRSPSRFLRRCAAAPAAAPELWFTYHLYHKAPDWLGPRIAGALGIPYVVAEASFAPKQAGGPGPLATTPRGGRSGRPMR